jgi:amidohydrolase
VSFQAGAAVDALQDELIAIRRDLHRHPETLYDVPRTAAFVADYLDALGLEVQRQVGKHFGKGVVAVLRGARPGKTVLLRADMDALPIEELREVEYKSAHPGRMHACGHDVHTTMLLGAAKVLSQHRDALCGTVKFVFQAAEEGAVASPLDGRLVSGGRDLIDAGVLDGVDRCFAFHVWPDLPIGVIGARYDYAMAASSHFRIGFEGLNGHHSTPHLAVDAISMAAQFVTEVKYMMASQLDPMEPAVLGFGTIKGGSVINAIAGASEVSGTFRAFSADAVNRIHAGLEARARAIAGSYGGRFSSQYRLGTAVRNDAASVDMARKAGAAVVGAAQVQVLGAPSLAGEDFALYLEQVPGAFVFLGVRNDAAGLTHPLHHPLFDVDEKVIALGVKLHIELAIRATRDEEKESQ